MKMRTLIETVRGLTETAYSAYHGTGSRFEQFFDGGMRPHFFTQDRDYALAYTGKTIPSLIGGKPKKSRNYLLTVELQINNLFDTKTDQAAVDFYNTQFLVRKNALLAKYNKPLWPEINIGKYLSFINADDFWRYCTSFNVTEYDGMLVDEGAFSAHPAIVPFRASQIKIIKRQIIKEG